MLLSRGRATTLAAVLQLEIFARAEAFVVTASESGLQRPVRWVHAAEIPDIAQFLSGGELLLTAGQGIGPTEAAQRRYVASIAQVGVAALAVELHGRVFSEMPAAVVDEARRRDLPLIGLRHEVPFVEASSQVLELLTEDTVRQFARTVEINQQLTERLVAGADHVALVRCIADNLGRPIILESADHDVRAYFGQDEPTAHLLRTWDSHSRSMESHADGVHGQTCVRRPVVVQGLTWGYLHMPAVMGTLETDRVVLEQGASAVAISLLHERVTGAHSRHQSGLLINRLLLGDVTGKGFVDRALRLGKDLRDAPLAVLLVGVSDGGPSPELERAVSADLRGTRLPAVTADLGDAVMSVIAVKGGDPALTRATRAVAAADRIVGVSNQVRPEDLSAAVEQAFASLYARQGCQHYRDLGLLRLLVPLAKSGELASYVEDELGPILGHDHKHQSALYPTLVAFLDSEGNKTTAAERLCIQRRTLYYRLDKIGSVLGYPLEDSDARLRLKVAVKAAELLRVIRSFRTAADRLR